MADHMPVSPQPAGRLTKVTLQPQMAEPGAWGCRKGGLSVRWSFLSVVAVEPRDRVCLVVVSCLSLVHTEQE